MNTTASNGADLQRWGADPATWEHFFRLTTHLLPVVSNPHSPISPFSKLPEANKGKVPTDYNRRRQIRGILGWQSKGSTPALIRKFMAEPDYGICIATHLVRGMDVDITDPEISADIERAVDSHFGWCPKRRRGNSLKFLAAFTLPGKHKKRLLKIAGGRVEFLANGQQFIAAGTHQSGARYDWGDKLPEAFPAVTRAALDAFWTELETRYPPPLKTKPAKTQRIKGAAKADGKSAPEPHGLSPSTESRRSSSPEAVPSDDANIAVDSDDDDEGPVIEGDRNTYLFGEARKMCERGHDESIVQAHVHKLNQECIPPLFGDEIASIVASAIKTSRTKAQAMKREYESVSERPPNKDAPTPEDEDAPSPAAIRSVLRVEPLTLAMLKAAPPDPEVIVENLLLMDACGSVSPGGVGKTTLAIYEGVHIILGRPLWGRRIVKPGRVVFITAEDSERIVRTRLIQICRALHLSDAELEIVADGFYIEDLSMTGGRLVGVNPKTGAVQPTLLVADIIARYRDLNVSLVHLDPASLLGPGEQSGNDGMSELMRAARQIAAALRAACQIVHHVAQVVARSGIQDQYAGRGGTAFADNSRGQRQLVRIKQRGYEFDDRRYRIPDEVTDGQLADGDVLAILVHKLSYVKRDPRPIFIVRNGFGFRQFECEAAAAKVERTMEEDIEVITGFVQRELLSKKPHSRDSLEGTASQYGMTQNKARGLIKIALERGVLIYVDRPQKGGLQRYLTVAEEVPDDLQTSNPS
jgi:hypothetical protein